MFFPENLVTNLQKVLTMTKRYKNYVADTKYFFGTERQTVNFDACFVLFP